MDGSRDYRTKSERERQIWYTFTPMWNLKYDTNELIYETEKGPQRKRTDVVAKGGGGGGGLVANLCPTPATPWTVTRQAPLSMGILQARILEWVAISSSRDQTQVSYVSCTGRQVLYH